MKEADGPPDPDWPRKFKLLSIAVNKALKKTSKANKELEEMVDNEAKFMDNVNQMDTRTKREIYKIGKKSSRIGAH